MDDDLLLALRALADPSRLRILGLLGGGPRAVDELASSLRLTPATVVHHLGRLREAGFVEARPNPPFVEYRLRPQRVAETARRLRDAAHPDAERPALAAGPDGVERPAWEAKVLRSFVVGGRLERIPAQEKKRVAVLRWIAETAFDAARDYPEPEVNDRLARINPDVAALRRYLVDARFMERASGIYRLRPFADWPPA